MNKYIKKASVLAVALGATASLAACGNSKSGSDSSKKTITISVDKGYKDYINEVKGSFERRTTSRLS